MKALLLIIVILAFNLTSVSAQSTTTDGWPIEQRCFPAPIVPPEDWSFDGTILLSGRFGIHGFRIDWATPRVLVFLNDDFNLPGGALSPDGKWYASPWGHTETTETFNYLTIPREIRVYSTVDEQILRIPFRDLFAGGTFSQIVWLDNEHFLYHTGINRSTKEISGLLEINPFTQTMVPWLPASKIGDNGANMQILSPDRMLTIYTVAGGNTWDWGLYDLKSGQQLHRFPFDQYRRLVTAAWSHDSSQFVLQTQANQLGLYDRLGTQTAILMQLPIQAIIGSDSIAWSDDGQYLAFIVYNYPDDDLYIVDMQQQKIVDTCFDTNTALAWIPSTHNLLLIQTEPAGKASRVIVADVDQNVPYIVAYHEGFILGWRGD